MEREWDGISVRRTGVLLADWRRAMSEMRRRHDRLVSEGLWLTGPSDFLDIIGRARDENTHSRMLEWLLNPTGRHGLGSALVRRRSTKPGSRSGLVWRPKSASSWTDSTAVSRAILTRLSATSSPLGGRPVAVARTYPGSPRPLAHNGLIRPLDAALRASGSDNRLVTSTKRQTATRPRRARAHGGLALSAPFGRPPTRCAPFLPPRHATPPLPVWFRPSGRPRLSASTSSAPIGASRSFVRGGGQPGDLSRTSPYGCERAAVGDDPTSR